MILGETYRARFQHFGENADIENAIKFQGQAVLLTPDGHLYKPLWLGNLGISYATRFKRLGELEDINKAIEYQTQAVETVSDSHSHKLVFLNNLGTSYKLRFHRLGELADLDKGISFLSQALLLTPDGHAHKPSWLDNLGASYESRFECLGDLTACSYFQSAARLMITKPETQLKCARRWAELSCFLGFSPLVAYARCMELIPYLIWLGSTIDRRYSLLTTISDLATGAAAWAISVQSYNLAIEWLEEGRSVVWNQILQLRTPFDDLYTVNPLLAKRLKDIASQLEAAGTRQAVTASSIDVSYDLEKAAQHHRLLATEWDQLLDQARSIPGFDNFMRPRKADSLMRAARGGPVALINMHKQCCDALIILPDKNEITHVHLETFSQEKAIDITERLKTVIQSDRARGLVLKHSKSGSKTEQVIRRMLGELWLDVVKPVLNSLEYNCKQPGIRLPHITWCTTGLLSFLPLHAAGAYDGSQPNAFDLVVTSYTPTLGALLSTTPQVYDSTSGILAVGQEYTEGFSDLPNTVHELAAIMEHAGSTRHLKIDGNGCTIEAVLQAMNEYSCVHLACHATQNTSNPALSAFHLNDGSLTLQTIMKKMFKNKGLAFLSACQTAAGDNNLPDEAIHLAGGMLMAGYPSVVATMWSIYDEDAPEVARQVYTELLKDGELDCMGAARALHKAIACLRGKVGEGSFERWVPFIHIGV